MRNMVLLYFIDRHSINFYGLNGVTKALYTSIVNKVTAGGVGTESGDLAFSTKLLGTLSEKMRIQSNGSVGIGTTAPVGKVDVRDGEYYITDTNLAHGMTGVIATNVAGWVGMTVKSCG